MDETLTNKNLLFLRSEAPGCRVIVLQGGTRSGKTYSVLQYIIELCSMTRGIVYTIARKTLPSLKATVMRDFIEILDREGLYSVDHHNKSDHTYDLWGNTVEFISLDDEQKVRGRKRTILFINEANEADLDTWRQLMLRTSTLAVIDYNPSDADHWIYDEVLTRADCRHLITTYKDNPHLSPAQVAEIEGYRDLDPDYWRVFGEGERGKARRGQIFTHIEKAPMPVGRYFYGLDFGQSVDPTALVRCFYDGSLYLEEVIYQTNLTSSEIVSLFKEYGVSTRDPIYADSSLPLMIREIRSAGYNIQPAEKGAGSIQAGIDKIRSMRVYATPDSANLWREAGWYCWKLDRSGKPTNVPMDINNHLFDATRYAISKEVMRPKLRGLKVL